jgi:HrpA-like RNA helicase
MQNNSNSQSYQNLSNKSIKSQLNLPIYKYENEIVKIVKESKNNITILIGETGSGKTTQVPQILYKHFKNSICVTQPRRVAAISVALRVAQESNCPVGSLVGYAVRFDEKYSTNTKIKYVTDGMLLRECILDPMLSKYNIIILDEAHERSVNSDTLLALIKNLLNSRKDLKLVVMSATLDIKKFSEYLNTTDVIMIKGRSFPIEVYNVLDNQKSYIDSALSTILQIHMNDEEEYKEGDILVFLPGQEDIEDLQELLIQKLEKIPGRKDYEIFPLFSALPNQEQMRIFYPIKDKRKIILATNIAETSITIKGIKFVIDSGYFKIRNYIHKSSIDTLKVEKISKNSAIQRAGRAGRESAGKCFRLYTEKEFDESESFNLPEILRINLRNLVLNLKAIGLDDISNFDFIDRPEKDNFSKAYDELVSFKALNRQDLKLTETGKQMSILPVEPTYALILINSLQKEFLPVKEEILTIISLLQTDNIFYTPSIIKEKVEKIREKFTHQTSDHLTLLNVYNQWKENSNGNGNKNFAKDHFLNDKALRKADDVKKQLRNYLNKINKNRNEEEEKNLMMEEMLNKIENFNKSNMDNEASKKEELIVKCLLTGYFGNIAKYSSDNYFTTIKEKHLCKIHPTSILIKNPKLGKFYEYVIYNDVIVTNKQYLKTCTLVREELVRKYLNKN